MWAFRKEVLVVPKALPETLSLRSRQNSWGTYPHSLTVALVVVGIELHLMEVVFRPLSPFPVVGLLRLSFFCPSTETHQMARAIKFALSLPWNRLMNPFSDPLHFLRVHS